MARGATTDGPPIVSRSFWARGGKRAFDLLIGLCLLAVAAPVLLLAILAMKITSPGPAFFFQKRTGRHGSSFQPFKLRTMRADWKHDPNEIVPLTHSGIASVGRFLRRLKIDELPQLLNVVRGEMSLIGPRPTLPEQTREYDAFQRKRLLVRPGLTGLAQVHGNAAIPWSERIQYDVYYVRNHSMFMDMAIAIKTVAVVVRGEERFAIPFDSSRFA
jgi:undecaprenyl phosphate N,N'-diacetylbacillosamine 1-phosphate transferase